MEGDEKSKRRRLNLLDRIECGHEEMKVEAWNGDSCGIWGLPHDRTSYDDNDVSMIISYKLKYIQYLLLD